MPRRSTTLTAALWFASLALSCHAFVVPHTTTMIINTRLGQSSDQEQEQQQGSSYLNDLSAQNPNLGAEPRANPDRPNLPEIPGDYDWDAKYANDADWVPLTDQSVPGKRVLNEVEIAQQASALTSLEDKWRAEREQEQMEQSKSVGFVESAELFNGRVAMFFLVTGLLTELWTGVSLPGQVEEMLRITGVIGYD